LKLEYAIAIAGWSMRTAPSPAGFGVVIRQGDRCVEFKMHSCHDTAAGVTARARAFVEVLLAPNPQVPRVFITSGAEVDRARTLAREAALIPHKPERVS
jgi:hypothetical protein